MKTIQIVLEPDLLRAADCAVRKLKTNRSALFREARSFRSYAQVEDGMRQPCAANLHNVVTVAQSVLGRRLAQLSAHRMREVCAALAFALGCEPS
jgi:mRNA-degrading endonuclease toxin of MazEF toxin-antitoxin module